MKKTETVYLLGAGASRGSRHRLPLMGEFFTYESLRANSYSNLRRAIRTAFPRTSLNRLNLEWVLTYLDLTLSPVGNRWGGRSVSTERSQFAEARRELEKYIVDRLKVDETMKTPCEIHVALVRALEYRDTVLTLNYDLIMDRAFYSCGDGRLNGLLHLTSIPAFQGGEPMAPRPGEIDPGLYIKLHGSIDWATCPRPECGNHEHFGDMRQAGWERHVRVGAPCRRCGTALELAIVTPSLIKEFDRMPKLALLWNAAHRALGRCTRLVISGVSFAPSDSALRWLIQHSLVGSQRLEEVILVTRDDWAFRQLKGLLPGLTIRRRKSSFQQWVKSGALE